MTVAAVGLSLLCTSAAFASPKTIMVTMRAENKSGESGTARLMQLPNGVQIVISLKGAPMEAQPTHIHPGTCQKLNPAPEYPLTSVVNGQSTTFLKGQKLSALMGGKFAINVHKSAADLKTYVSCGAIK
jgi:hypothetical protein